MTEEGPGVLPRLVVDVDVVDHNIAVLHGWAASRDAALAPHVKTTMTRGIVERQRAGGAQAVTVATVEQAAVVLGWGWRRIVIANEVVDRAALRALARWVHEGDGPGASITVFVDSAEGVARASAPFAGGPAPLPVVIDVGLPGARAGVRDPAAGRRLAETEAAAPGVRLVGVGGYEGVAGTNRESATLRAVDEHCQRTTAVFETCAPLLETDVPLYTMGGSMFLDRVVDHAPRAPAGARLELLLRPGCYVVHDHGAYAAAAPVEHLEPAAHVEAMVISAPERGLAVIGAGRRDLPYDAGMPAVADVVPARGSRSAPPWRVDRLFDHHAVIAQETDLRVGDVVRLTISHPCSAFDRYTGVLATSASHAARWWPTSFDRLPNLP